MALDLPAGKIINKFGLQPNGRIQKYFTNRAKTRMDKYTPFDTGMLRTNTNITESNITYESPYAHYAYKGIKYVDPITKKGAFYNPNYGFWSRPNTTKIASNEKLRYHTPGTGPYWDKRMISAEGKDLLEDVKKYIKGVGNGD